MFGRLVIAYLLVASMAGPGWCCCTFAKIASCASRFTDKKPEAPVRCCCCSQEADSGKPSEDGSDPREQCPCKESRDRQPSLLVTSDPNGPAHDPTFSQPIILLLHGIEPIGRLGRGGDYIPPDHPSGRQLLIAIQVFRC